MPNHAVDFSYIYYILHMFPDQPHRMQQHPGVMNVETVDMCLACLASSQAMTSE